MTSRARSSVWLAGATTLVVASGCHARPAPEAAIQAVRGGLVEAVLADAPARYSAAIVPLAQVDLAFKSSGPVARLLQVAGADGRMRSVQAGDRVSRGAELGAVRASDYDDRVGQAQAEVDQAAAARTEAQAASRQAEADFARASRLLASASLTRPDFDQAQARRDSTAAAVKSAEAAVAGATAMLAEVRAALDDTIVRAPFAGTLTSRTVEIGTLVSPAVPAFGLMDDHQVKAVFAVPDSALGSVALGRRETVLLDVRPGPLTGTVTSIAPEADPKGRVFSIEVTLANADGALKPGMIGTLMLGPVRDTTRHVVVPLGAVVRAPNDPTGFAVFRLVDRGGKTYAAAQVIGVGDTYGSAIEVTSGLAAGDRIVILGGALLRDGQEVRVLP